MDPPLMLQEWGGHQYRIWWTRRRGGAVGMMTQMRWRRFRCCNGGLVLAGKDVREIITTVFSDRLMVTHRQIPPWNQNNTTLSRTNKQLKVAKIIKSRATMSKISKEPQLEWEGKHVREYLAGTLLSVYCSVRLQVLCCISMVRKNLPHI